jgi:hypothetical protein
MPAESALPEPEIVILVQRLLLQCFLRLAVEVAASVSVAGVKMHVHAHLLWWPQKVVRQIV